MPARREARWSGTVTSLEHVTAQIDRLTGELAAGEDREPHGVPRTCCLDLIVRVADDDRRVREIGDTIERIAPSHPLRAVVVRTREGARGIDAVVLCETCGRGVHRQEVVLTMPPAATARLADEVSTALVPGVPVYVWSLLPPDLTDPEAVDALSRIDALIVDSATLPDPLAVARDMRRFATRGAAAVGDLSWARIRRWREALAGFFAPADRRELLGRIEEVDVEHGAGPSGTMAGALVAGWKASRLGYELDGVESAGEGATARYREAGGRRVRVGLAAAGDDDGLRSIAVRGAGFEVGVRVESPDSARLRFDIRGRTVTQHLRWERQSDAELLCDLLVEAAHDAVYPAALGAAVELLEAR